jgi:hypothetical protein
MMMAIRVPMTYPKPELISGTTNRIAVFMIIEFMHCKDAPETISFLYRTLYPDIKIL